MRLTGTARPRALEREDDLQANALRARVDRQRPAELVAARRAGAGPPPGPPRRGGLARAWNGEPRAIAQAKKPHAALSRLGAHLHGLRPAVAGRVDHGLVHHELHVARELPR